MKLYYHKGKNFGDQLNPMIFDFFLPNTFNENDPDLFVGVGSLIGLVSRFPQKKLIFSSGLADGDAGTYGPVPQDLSSYEFICVRGPLTAKRLNLDPTLAITDGAILLAAMDLPLVRSQEVISFMPHAGSR
jgi:succinoglycan biosynthesis protein ExoV